MKNKNEKTPHELLYIKLIKEGKPAIYKGYKIIYHNPQKCIRCIYKNLTITQDFKDLPLLQNVTIEEKACDYCAKQADIMFPGLLEDKIRIIKKILITNN